MKHEDVTINICIFIGDSFRFFWMFLLALKVREWVGIYGCDMWKVWYKISLVRHHVFNKEWRECSGVDLSYFAINMVFGVWWEYLMILWAKIYFLFWLQSTFVVAKSCFACLSSFKENDFILLYRFLLCLSMMTPLLFCLRLCGIVISYLISYFPVLPRPSI